MLIGGYEDSLKRLGVQSWQSTDGAAPSYHFDMLQDTERNEAYRQGIEATLEEDDLVIDIGTGGGLLALMAGTLPLPRMGQHKISRSRIRAIQLSRVSTHDGFGANRVPSQHLA